MSRLSGVRTIFRTTLIDQSRDRRSMGAAFLYALLGPVVMLMAFTGIANTQDRSERLVLAVHGAEAAPELVRELEKGGARIERRTSGNPRDFGTADVVLAIPPDFATKLSQGQTGSVTLLRDDRHRSSAGGAIQLQRQIEEHGYRLAQARLTARGLAPDLARPIEVKDTNIAPVSVRSVAAVNMMLYFFILAPFFTSMTAAIDATAGERERQSLKPLLAQPIDPAGLIAGKWAVSSLFGIVGTTVTIVFGTFLIGFAPLEKLGMDLPLTIANQLWMALLLAPLALAVAAAQSLIAMLAKTFKEAQTYIQLLSLAPVALLMMASFSSEEPGQMARSLPLTGHSDLLHGLMTSGVLDARQAVTVTLVSLALAALCLTLSQRYVRDERLMGQL